MATKKMATAIKRRNSWKNAIFLWNCHLFIWKKIKAMPLHLIYTSHNLPMCTFKGQSLYWHFIRPLLLSAITQGVNPWKTYTRLFWHNGSRRSEVTITSWYEHKTINIVCLLHMCAVSCYLSQIQKIWYFDINGETRETDAWMNVLPTNVYNNEILTNFLELWLAKENVQIVHLCLHSYIFLTGENVQKSLVHCF